jgi:hypothetical protein
MNWPATIVIAACLAVVPAACGTSPTPPDTDTDDHNDASPSDTSATPSDPPTLPPTTTPTLTTYTTPDHWEGDGWDLTDGWCTVTATPSCEPVHLGVAATPPPDATPCTTHAECTDDEFCGAGSCRPEEGTMVTLCFEELWYEGPTDTPPDGQMVFYDESICLPCPYYAYAEHELRSAIASPPGRGCRITGTRCEQFPAAILRAHSLSSHGVRSIVNEGNDTCELYSNNGFIGTSSEPRRLLTHFVDAGCTPLQFDDYRTAWFSVWYP